MTRASAHGWRAGSLVAALALVGCAGGGRDEPRFFRAEGGRRLHLPPHMRLALWESDRRFQVLERRDFAREVIEVSAGWSYPFDAQQEPWAVLADFDGDGALDAALFGASGDTLKLVVVWAESSAPRVEQLRDRAWDRDAERGHLEEFLMRRPAGAIPWAGGEDDATFTIPHDAVELVSFEKAAVTLDCDGKTWHEIVTED